MLGFILGVCALVAIVKTAVDTYQESKQSKWPITNATITYQTVREAIEPKNYVKVWYIQSELRYSVDGEELTSTIRSRVTRSTEERGMMRRWASQHQPRTSLPVRYDPQHHNTVVPDAGDMPESGPQAPDDLNMILIFLLPSIALIAIGRALQRRQVS